MVFLRWMSQVQGYFAERSFLNSNIYFSTQNDFESSFMHNSEANMDFRCKACKNNWQRPKMECLTAMTRVKRFCLGHFRSLIHVTICTLIIISFSCGLPFLIKLEIWGLLTGTPHTSESRTLPAALGNPAASLNSIVRVERRPLRAIFPTNLTQL